MVSGEERLPIVVPDTNLFMAAYWNPRSASARLLAMAEEGAIRFAMSEAVEREVMFILSRVKPRAEYVARVRAVLAAALRVEPTERLQITEDPDDNKLLECAVAAHADYLATNDRHLLEVWRWEGTRIMPPGEVVRALAQ